MSYDHLLNTNSVEYLQTCILHARRNSYFPHVSVNNNTHFYINEQLYCFDQFETTQLLTIIRRLFPEQHTVFNNSLKRYNRNLVWQEICNQIKQYEIRSRESLTPTSDNQFNEAISVISSLITKHKYFVNTIDSNSVKIRVTSTGLELVIVNPIIANS
jgi:hypothetical protein